MRNCCGAGTNCRATCRDTRKSSKPHSRWRHFEIQGRDLWKELARSLDADTRELARIRFDLRVNPTTQPNGTRERHDVVAITGAMPTGTGTMPFAKVCEKIVLDTADQF